MDARWIIFDDSSCLRSGWRFAVFIAGFAFVTILVGQIAAVLLPTVWNPNSTDAALLVLNGLVLLIPSLLVGWLCGKYLEGLPFRALGAWFTTGWWKHLLSGIVVGAATLAFAVLIAFAFGALRFETNSVDGSVLYPALGSSFLIFAAGAAWEEALFRGYILQTFNRSGLAWFGILLTAMFFGAIHAQNPNASLISTLNTMLAGVWFGVAYLKTRDLWFVWGVHLMWNWMQGSFFGIEVSGMTELVSTPLLREIDGGPVWLTGESYGIEGGIVTTIAIVVSTIVIYYLPYLKPSEEIVNSD